MTPEEVYAEHEILATKVRRRNKLRLQLSVLGVTADPSISMQIEDLDREIAESSRKLNIKPEGIFIDTSINLNDRRVLLLQVAYDQSYIIIEKFADCCRLLLDYSQLFKDAENNREAIEEKKKEYHDEENKLWIEVMALEAIFRENRLYFSKKADSAIGGFNHKVFRFYHFDWFDLTEQVKEAVMEWNEYITRAHKNIVDVARSYIEAEQKKG